MSGVFRRQGWWLLPVIVVAVAVGLTLGLWASLSTLHTAATGCPADNGKGKCEPGWAINLALPIAIGSGIMLALLARLGVWKWREWFGDSGEDASE